MFWDWILTISLGLILSMFELDSLYNMGQMIASKWDKCVNKIKLYLMKNEERLWH